jgi:hypothetical protein
VKRPRQREIIASICALVGLVAAGLTAWAVHGAVARSGGNLGAEPVLVPLAVGLSMLAVYGTVVWLVWTGTAGE